MRTFNLWAICCLLVFAFGCFVAADDAPAATNDLKLGEAVEASLKQAEETVLKLGEQLKQALKDFKLGGETDNKVVKDARKRRSMQEAWAKISSSSSSSESKETPNEVKPIVEAIPAANV